jgi:hypothetical protein
MTNDLNILQPTPTPVLRYFEEPDSSDDRSGSSAYLRTGVREL